MQCSLVPEYMGVGVCTGWAVTQSLCCQSAKAIRDALATERELVRAIMEERERNMLLIMNAFSRVGKLAQVRVRAPKHRGIRTPSILE